MQFETLVCRDLVAPDLLPPDLIDATSPGSEHLNKGGSPNAVSVLLEMDIETST